MNLCSDNHDEVCYDGRYCPCCIIARDLDLAEDKIKELKLEIEQLEQAQADSL